MAPVVNFAGTLPSYDPDAAALPKQCVLDFLGTL